MHLLMTDVGFGFPRVWGILGSAVGKDDVHRNARRCRRIHTGSNPTSVMSKNFLFKVFIVMQIIFLSG